ncbi:hypothetical protein TVAG_013390 [Trichomonas vaginalis G3]|uniref:Uncharacterized protein n=1 Tax=Trichomonas vaginalis (strain ATCC PRA-98 / G3) TaxID=412133 RepID=A2DD95_TRIV3|nr:hypothetical protein TVAGG3_0987060 [Trichomonas vaginalis G3]EAY21574.1 hypothetical protein TVAG_013390 [Trichomonas vaginalis G3]KAI5489752.1 hypothetical protein TVAGG3_0987060 [Trichomonas vaginalis G3]|eukprot:XP_001582560.1 hypothetical protein [Trichomonas vaginalis G3]
MTTNEENKKKVMESHIFGGAPQSPPQQRRTPSRANQAPLPPLADEIQIQRQQPPPQPQNDFNFQRSPQRPQQQPQPAYKPDDRLNLVTPHSSRFATATQINRPPVQNFDGLVKESSVPPLSPFPEFTFEPPQIQTNFEFHVKPLTAQSSRSTAKKLTINSNSEIRKIRDEIQADSAEFASKLQQIQAQNAPGIHV